MHTKTDLAPRSLPRFLTVNPRFAAFATAALLAAAVAPDASARPVRLSPGGDAAHFDEDTEVAPRHRMSKEERKALRKKVREKIHMRLVADLAERLALDEKKSQQLAESIEKHGLARRQHGKRLREEMKKLKTMLAENASDIELRTQMSVLSEARQQRKDGMQSLLRDTESFLSTREQAMLVLAFPRVMKDTRKMMRKARHDRRKGGEGDEKGRHPRHHEDGLDDDEPFGFED